MYFKKNVQNYFQSQKHKIKNESVTILVEKNRTTKHTVEYTVTIVDYCTKSGAIVRFIVYAPGNKYHFE